MCAEWGRTASSRASRSARDTTRLPRPVSSDADVPGAVTGLVSRAQKALLEYVLSAAAASAGRPSSLGVFPASFAFVGVASVAGLQGRFAQLHVRSKLYLDRKVNSWYSSDTQHRNLTRREALADRKASARNARPSEGMAHLSIKPP